MKIAINEDSIREMVRETLRTLISESAINELMSNIGENGKLSASELHKPQDLFQEEYKKMDAILSSGTKVNIEKEFGNTLAYAVWKQYVVAMLGSFNVDRGHRPIPTVKVRKGVEYPKVARAFFGWLSDVRRGKIDNITDGSKYPILAYKYGNSFLFGHWMHGFFIACYVSPYGRELMTMISELCKYSNVCFMVTLDMASILESAGLYTDGKVYPTRFNGSMVDKKVFGTSPEALDFVLMVEKGSSVLRSLKDRGIDRSKIDKIRNDVRSGNINDILKAVGNGIRNQQ